MKTGNEEQINEKIKKREEVKEILRENKEIKENINTDSVRIGGRKGTNK
jgi:hypothetical protein